MSDLTVITATTKMTLEEIAKQATALATGLQNVAPGDKLTSPNNSVSYLFAVAEELSKLAAECENLLSTSSGSQSGPKI